MTANSQQPTSGWVVYSTTMFVIAGVFNVIFGLAMLFNSTWAVFTPNGVWILDISSWGWITLIVGAAELLVAWGVGSGKPWGRVFGIVIASIAALNALFLVPIYPIWGLIVLVLAILIVYGLAVHGDEVA